MKEDVYQKTILHVITCTITSENRQGVTKKRTLKVCDENITRLQRRLDIQSPYPCHTHGKACDNPTKFSSQKFSQLSKNVHDL